MSSLFQYIAKRIIVDLHLSKFTFSIKEKDINISFAPFLYIENSESRWMPIAIGEEISKEQLTKSNIHRVELFNLENKVPSDIVWNKEVLIQLLFEYGIGRCFENFWFPQLRPVVFILGASRFSEQLEHPKEVFENAAKRGGARKVVFDKTEL
jgi:hypothetical protein